MDEALEASEVVFNKVGKMTVFKKRQTVILKECSFKCERQKLTVLIGPSGCGKTTIINLIAGYERPDLGEVLIDGKKVPGPDWERLVVFQETALFPWLTCYENVMFGPLARQVMSEEAAHNLALGLLRKVGLEGFHDKHPSQLSGGMQRRAELARALINQPRVMLMDEPFRGLDAMTRKLMQEYYLKLFEENNATHVFVTSEVDEAIFLADNLMVMTNRPSRVKKEIHVDLERPRNWSIATSKRYLEIKAEALELLHEEALKASKTSEKVDIDLSGFSQAS
ncbi:MAG: ABC transporter ATP-binding protein [Deltaproteobacteria bacterium]|nr:ABC transporter ATP-binding protein [Deltaproteobacteria bacterium]MBW1958730.1 ABC transporter ATP-binding protein [Deltaproteobacteria bacterium]